jgi:hypothetical protein
MEVIRWLCKEPRDHLRQARFLIHTHNAIAGMLMVLHMHACGYRAEFRPFGIDPVLLLRRDEDEASLAAEAPRRTESLAFAPDGSRRGRRLVSFLKALLSPFRLWNR